MIKETEHMRKRNGRYQTLADSRRARARKSYQSQCRNLANDISDALTSDRHQGLSVDRVRIAGSVGKKTALGAKHKPDLDIVIYLNDVRPPSDWNWVLRSIRKILERKRNDGFVFTKQTKYSLQCEMDFYGDTIKIDLLPAVNFSRNRQKQCETVRKRILRDFERIDHRYLSSSLAEEQVDFVIKQPNWITDTIRIAKLWFKSCLTPVYGGSCLIEVIAIDACLGIRGGRRKQPFYGFNRFLLHMRKLNKLKITFDRFFDERDIPYSVKHTKGPLIMDPTNPVNNLAENLDDDDIEVLMDLAKETLYRNNIPKYYSDFNLLFDFGYYFDEDETASTSYSSENIKYEDEDDDYYDDFRLFG